MESETIKKVGKGAGGVSAITLLGVVAGFFWNEFRDLRNTVIAQGERIAGLEARQGRIVDHIVWKDGDNQYTAAIQEDKP